MIPLAVPNLCGKEREYLNKCIDSTFVSTVGEFVNKFESLISSEVSALETVCVNTGTSALHVSLVTLGVKKNELVILPSLTFIASANAIAYTGAEPWLIDVSPSSWTLDPDLLERELFHNTKVIDGEVIHTNSGKKVSCIMPVYTLGCPADMDKINEIAKKYNLPILADGAAAIGAKYKDKKLAEIADITTFSFNGNKTITSGGGGALFSNNIDLIKKARHLTTTARVGMDYYHDEVGFNYRMTNIEAAVGCAQIENVDIFVKRKREVNQFYQKKFAHVEGVSLFPSPPWADSSCWFSGIVLNNYDDKMMKQLIAKISDSNVMARPFWRPIHLQPKFESCITSSMEVSNFIWNKILVLPCSTNIKDEELEEVVHVVLNALEQIKIA